MIIAPFHTALTAPPFTQRIAIGRLSSVRVERLFSAMLFSLFLLFVATEITYADQTSESWIPEVIALPDDAEMQTNRNIGPRIRMLSFSTETDAAELLEEWSVALKADGYSLRPQRAELSGTTIEFSGGDILNAKVEASASIEDDRAVITLDATLR